MKYTVTWHRFPNGKETDEMTANWREFETFEKALIFLQSRIQLIKSTHWAGGCIEESESPYRTVYDIDYEGNAEDLCYENIAKTEQSESTVSKPEQNEIPQEAKEVLEEVIRPAVNTLYKTADKLIVLFSEFSKACITTQYVRPPPAEN